MNYTIHQLQIFLKVVQTQSVTKAKVTGLILNFKKESEKIQANLERILEQDTPFNYIEDFL